MMTTVLSLLLSFLSPPLSVAVGVAVAVVVPEFHFVDVLYIVCIIFFKSKCVDF